MENELKVNRFSTAREDANQSDKIKEETSKGVLKFGVGFLDEATTGIVKTDLIVLGGKSGGGKTELAAHIAMTNAMAGNKVYFFALEAHHAEIGMRLKYKELAKRFFRDNHSYKKSFIAYDRWKANQLNKEFAPYEKEVNEFVNQNFDNLSTRYIDDSFTFEDFERDMVAVRQDAKLVIVDHLHYFDIDENSNENAAYKKLVKGFRTMSLQYKIPIILVSHIRKSGRFEQSLAPDQEEFHGSSDIVKISTKAITIASANGKKILINSGESFDEMDIVGSPSFMKLAKYREGGYATYFTSLVKYNSQTNAYDDTYLLGEPYMHSRELKFLQAKGENVPLWAKSATNETRSPSLNMSAKTHYVKNTYGNGYGKNED